MGVEPWASEHPVGSAAQAGFSWAQLTVSALVQPGVRKESHLSVLSR